MKETAKQMKETDRKIKELSNNIGGVSNSNGDPAENYFINSLGRRLEFAGIKFDYMNSNRVLKKRMPDGSIQAPTGEIDIIMLNGNSVALIEVKYKAKSSDVENLVDEKVGKFRESHPAYKDFAIYLGLGSFSFDDYVVKKAKELGVGLLKQVGEVVEYENMQVKAY
jgi:hypothetical protein